jgi:hypothetical protein
MFKLHGNEFGEQNIINQFMWFTIEKQNAYNLGYIKVLDGIRIFQ